jgi:titin
VTTTKSTITSVTELNENTSYDFRVRAETEQGEGESVEINAVLTKALEKKELTSKVLEVPLTKPTISVSKAVLQVGANQMMQMDAIFTGHPRPTLFWTHNGQTIEDSRRVRIEERRFDMICTITIKKTEISDSGTYTVIAKSAAGEATAEFTLTIVGKAGPPRNLTAIDISPQSATLTWDVPLSDGGTLIKQYLVEKRSAGRTTWMKVTTVKETTSLIKDLVQGSKFEFRVRAETEEGEGESAEIGPILADYTFGKPLSLRNYH